ncbi:hypothetical protein AX16_005706 [Volvariella volvacea WC 439]|nr:hypothetical protein AX16_005706 [Volvariella volvacea WC 439]
MTTPTLVLSSESAVSGRVSPTSVLGLPMCQSPRNSTYEDPAGAPINYSNREATGDCTIWADEPEELSKGKLSPKASQDLTAPQYLLPEKLSDCISTDLLIAMCPSESQRYERRVEMPKFEDTQFIGPYRRNFTKPNPPSGWGNKVAFDGAPYFFKEFPIIDSTDQLPRHLTVVTDANVCVDTTYDKIEGTVRNILEYLRRNELVGQIDGWHLTLELRMPTVKEGRPVQRVGYYFVDHKQEVIFWFDEFDAADMETSFLNFKFTDGLIGHEIQAQYWNHNDAFPGMYPYNAIEKLLPRLQDELIGHMGEHLLAPNGTTTPWSEEDLAKFLSLCKDMKALGKSNGPVDSSSRIIFRILYHIEHERFLNSFGEENARLDRRQSLYGPRKLTKTWVTAIIAPLLFFAPNAHLHTLRDASVDGIVRRSIWNTIVKRLVDEWKEHVLYSTVLLNANVAFLTIQSIDEVERVSPIQIASYLSICASIGAIVVGLVLARQHASTIKSQFLANRSASQSGLETLAIMYSLPYGLLVWGMVSFFVAFAWMCYSKLDVITIVILTITVVFLLFAIVWCISASYEDRPYLHPAPAETSLLEVAYSQYGGGSGEGEA